MACVFCHVARPGHEWLGYRGYQRAIIRKSSSTLLEKNARYYSPTRTDHGEAKALASGRRGNTNDRGVTSGRSLDAGLLQTCRVGRQSYPRITGTFACAQPSRIDVYPIGTEGFDASADRFAIGSGSAFAARSSRGLVAGNVASRNARRATVGRSGSRMIVRTSAAAGVGQTGEGCQRKQQPSTFRGAHLDPEKGVSATQRLISWALPWGRAWPVFLEPDPDSTNKRCSRARHRR